MENTIRQQYQEAMNKSEAYEYYIESKYCEEDILTIHSLLSYMVNQYNGFAHLNDEKLYMELKTNEQLFDEATKWFELSKECIRLGKSIRKLNKERRKTIYFP